MSYPRRTETLRPTGGFISDTPAHEVGPNFWTLMQNAITRAGFAQRLPASRTIHDAAVATAAPVQFLHAINCQFSGTNYWLAFEADGTAWAIEGTNAVQVDGALLQAVTDPVDFSSSRLNGVPVVSNAADEPVFWSGSGNVATLTDWTATETCGFIVAFKFHLFAMDISGPAGTFRSLVKWSDAAEPGTIPNSWTPGPATQAGDVELSDTPGEVLCAYPLGDQLVLYKPSADYLGRYVEGNNVFVFKKTARGVGALSRRAVCAVPGRHFVATDGDIIFSDGTNVSSLGEAKTKDWFFNQLDQDTYANLFTVYNRGRGEVILGFPSAGNTFCDVGLVYSLAHNSFGVRDLNQIAHAAVGLVNDAAPSRTWADAVGTWADQVGTWGGSDVTTARSSLVLVSADELVQQDAASGTMSALIGKHSMAFGDPLRVKLVRAVHISAAPGYGELFVRLGSQMEATGPTRWSPETAITDPEQTATCFAQGRYISLEIRSTGSATWKITSVRLEIEFRGYH